MKLSDVGEFIPNGIKHINKLGINSNPKWFIATTLHENDEEIEVFYFDNVVLLTRGLSPSSRHLFKRYTMEDNIKSVFLKDGIWILDNRGILSVQNKTGNWMYNSLPFVVDQMWCIFEAFLFRRQSPSDGIPTLFSLSHPLDELAPVLLEEHSQRVEYFSHDHYNIIFTSPKHSFVLLYDCSTHVHVICITRPITHHDLLSISQPSNLTQSIMQQLAICPSSSSSIRKSLKSIIQHSTDVPLSKRLSASSIQNVSSFSQPSDHPKSVIPQICLERVWNEKTCTNKAEKAFVCEDVSGTEYLCYLVSSELRMISFKEKKIFDCMELPSIPCYDACFVKGLNLTLVIAPDWSFKLYSGPYYVTEISFSFQWVTPTLTNPTDDSMRLIESYDRCVFMEFSSEFKRVVFEEAFSTEIVGMCLKGLLKLLPSSISSCIFGLWYTKGSYFEDNHPQKDEWTRFRHFLAEICGLLIDYDKIKKVKSSIPKRPRDNSDWEFLKGKRMTNNRGMTDLLPIKCYSDNCILSHCLLDTLFALHLVYENLKLIRYMLPFIAELGEILYHIARKSSLIEYVHHYWKDDPRLEFDFASYHFPVLESIECTYFCPTPPNIYEWISSAYSGDTLPKFIYLDGVCDNTKLAVQLVSVIADRRFSSEMHLQVKSVFGNRLRFSVETTMKKKEEKELGLMERVVLAMIKLNITTVDIETLPQCIYLPCLYAILWVLEYSHNHQLISCPLITNISTFKKARDKCEDPPFPSDSRMIDAARMLSSSDPVIMPSIEHDDDLINYETLEEDLGKMLVRVYANSVGRGIMNYRDSQFYASETFEIPELVTLAKLTSTGKLIEVKNKEVYSSLKQWGEFHNGVSAGLCISHNSKIDSGWISYHRLKTGNVTPEYSGMLFGLGLNGHLHDITSRLQHNYLKIGNTQCTMSLLLGMAVGRFGTGDMSVTSLLNVHSTALLNGSTIEFPLPVQSAAILGIGMVHFSAWNASLLNTLLNEIAVFCSPQDIGLEAYSLCAGLSFGMISMGKGDDSDEIAKMTQTLLYLMEGSRKSRIYSLRGSVHNKPSHILRDGHRINSDVSSFAATVALGLLYFNTSNRFIIESLSLPNGVLGLSAYKPGIITLRSLSLCLVGWGLLDCTEDCLLSTLPLYMFSGCHKALNNLCLDNKELRESFMSHLGGWALAVGIKLVSSNDRNAMEFILGFFYKFVEYSESPIQENTILCLILSASLIMTGSGCVTVLAACRYLRSRFVSDDKYKYVNYGSHMAVAMSIGLLFFGKCRHRLTCTPRGIVGMLCAFYPHFPSRGNGNRYHLQPMRHLYTLACDSSCSDDSPLIVDNSSIEHLFRREIIFYRSVLSVKQVTPDYLLHLNNFRLIKEFFSSFSLNDPPRLLSTQFYIDHVYYELMKIIEIVNNKLYKFNDLQTHKLMCYLLGPRLDDYGVINEVLIWYGVDLRYEKTVGTSSPSKFPLMSDVMKTIPQTSLDFARFIYSRFTTH